MKVLKFGGSCLKNSDSLRTVLEIIERSSAESVVVVSAVSGVTDLLIRSIGDALISEHTVEENLERILKLHEDVIRGFQGDVTRRILDNLRKKMDRLRRLLLGVAYTQEVTPHTRSSILSFGERLSAILLSELLNHLGTKSLALEADEIGIVTDENFESATVVMEETSRNLRKNLVPCIREGCVPIVTGFFGVSEKGKITTFGRNGSDYTAAVVAASLDAEVLELWKDVEGFMSADPKIVDDAEVIDRLSYYEAAELSYFGARIVHPRTFEPLLDKGIPVVIKSILNPEAKGTLITPQGYVSDKVVKSITYNRRIGVLKILGPGVGYKPGVIAEVGKALTSAGINIYSILTSQTCINLLLDKSDMKRATEVLSALKDGIIADLVPRTDIVLVGVVGEGLMEKEGIFGEIFSKVAGEGVNVEMVSAGASRVAYYFVVREDDLIKTINAIHDWIIEE